MPYRGNYTGIYTGDFNGSITGLINSSFKAPSVFILLGNLEARTGTWEMGISITKN
ncbi:hypothetical protein [Chryseobacterium sp. CBo1]|uniref:hypothetical protein n=1 Tax=Chryseobacterium sp. CBo1 TaxID=1869230 RepID=UPI0013F4ED29|nr:hypothetical protein [Chryseobacterium sp. CBo1]